MRTARADSIRLRRRAQRDHQLVHHIPGIDARADQRDPPRLGLGVELRRPAPDTCGTDTPAPRTLRRRTLPRQGTPATVPSRSAGRKTSNGSPRPAIRRAWPRRHRRSARPMARPRPDHVAQVAPRLGRIGIDRPDNLDRVFFPHQPHDGRTDGTDAVLHRANFFLQSWLRSKLGANTIKELRGAFNLICARVRSNEKVEQVSACGDCTLKD